MSSERLKAPYYRFIEPYPMHGNSIVTLSRESCLDWVKSVAKIHEHTYSSDEEAIKDFITIHWAEPTEYANPLLEIRELKGDSHAK